MTDEKKKLNRIKHRKRAQDYLRLVAMFHGCQLCAERSYVCLDFHHVNPDKKEGDVHYMVRNKWSQKKIINELIKCACVCSNCHRKIHFNDSEESKKVLTTLSENVLINLDKLMDVFGFETIRKTFIK